MLDLIRMINAVTIKLDYSEEQLKESKKNNDELTRQSKEYTKYTDELVNEIISIQDKYQILVGKNKALQEALDRKTLEIDLITEKFSLV